MGEVDLRVKYFLGFDSFVGDIEVVSIDDSPDKESPWRLSHQHIGGHIAAHRPVVERQGAWLSSPGVISVSQHLVVSQVLFISLEKVPANKSQ